MSVFAGTDAAVLEELYADEHFSQEDLTPKASRSCNKAGHYHGCVLGVKRENPDHQGINSVVRIDIQILAGEHPDQKDAMVYHRVRLFKVVKDQAGKPIGREPYGHEYISQAMRIAAGLGLCPREGGMKLGQIQWDAAAGRQCVFKIDADEEEYNNKKQMKYQINFGNVWRPDEPEVAEVPKDPEAMAIYTGGTGAGAVDISGI